MKNITLPEVVHDCTGCGLCAAVCPTNAVSIVLSDDGFYVPSVDSAKCVECGKCIRTCYKYDVGYQIQTNELNGEIICMSAKNRNANELQSSSSGAVSIELMRCCIEKGYKVVGVAYDNEQERAVSKIASTLEELEQFKGSKYFQSYTENAYRSVIQDKSDEKYAIFGTPCQIYAFSKYIEQTNNTERFLLVDIFCHGCPSLNLWKRYLKQKKTEYCVSEFEDIKFRSKTHGWHEFCFDFIKGPNKFTSSKYNDSFYEIFFGNAVLNGACYDCVARSSVEKTDIRLGDFWGTRFDFDTEGVSAVALCTEAGRGFFNEIKDKFDCAEVSFEEVIAAQSYGTEYGISKEIREKALEILKQDISYAEMVKRHRSLMPYKVRVKNSFKKLLKRLPYKQYMSLKATFQNMNSLKKIMGE